MVKNLAPPHPEEDMEEEEPDYGDDFPTRQDSSSLRGEAGRVEGRKAGTSRSKHSETEQRRRSKINERFQILRDLIPQNDTKRDKASFLLEVIEYVQFLQEKLQAYEGSYHAYNNQEPSKLTPWRKINVAMESHMDPAQVMKNGIGNDINVIVNPQMVSDTQNSLDSGPPQMFTASSTMASHSDSEMWETTIPPFTANYAVPNCSENQHEQPSVVESESSSLSSAYSQGVLHTFTQALQSSGVDLSQAKISVQIDVAKKRASYGLASTSTSKGHESAAQGGVGSYNEAPDIPSHKRHRTEKNE